MKLDYLKDSAFLKQLDNENNKTIYVKIVVLDLNENPIREISGRVSNQGSVNIDGKSAMRRTANITFLAEEVNNDLQNVDNILSINKKIQLLIGVENTINNIYDNIIWFPMGIYVIIQPNLSHSLQGVTISLTLKDKMCLLNGECGGTLPASITFHEYSQLQPDGSSIDTPQLIFDIIQTLVCNYGGVPISKIIINDIPREIKQIVRYVGSIPLYYNTVTSVFSTDAETIEKDPNRGEWIVFNYNEDIGYTYTDFIYPGELISGIGENVCNILDKIKTALGNFEYFFDANGNFVFQEVRNYLNNFYNAIDDQFAPYRLYNSGKLELQTNNLNILDIKNYVIDYRSNNKSIYTFEEGNGLITSFSNSPSYTNIKNDFHIWGKNGENQVIHYHLALMNKPTIMNTYYVIFPEDLDGNKTGEIRLANLNEKGEAYIPSDWRAELYLRGLQKLQLQQRPDIYEQELLDLFGTIYDFVNKRFKVDLINNPNNLVYFFDALEPVDKMHGCSIDALYPRILVCQEEHINKLYNKDIPNIIVINQEEDIIKKTELIARCELEGQPYAYVTSTIYNKIVLGTVGYAAHTKARELLYQHTNYKETISLQSIPIYYLDVNRRITVHDMASNIYGDYVINNISIPLNSGGTMAISATRALERI